MAYFSSVVDKTSTAAEYSSVSTGWCPVTVATRTIRKRLSNAVSSYSEGAGSWTGFVGSEVVHELLAEGRSMSAAACEVGEPVRGEHLEERHVGQARGWHRQGRATARATAPAVPRTCRRRDPALATATPEGAVTLGSFGRGGGSRSRAAIDIDGRRLGDVGFPATLIG
jgi:hypothetical protein